MQSGRKNNLIYLPSQITQIDIHDPDVLHIPHSTSLLRSCHISYVCVRWVVVLVLEAEKHGYGNLGKVLRIRFGRSAGCIAVERCVGLHALWCGVFGGYEREEVRGRCCFR